MRPGMFDNDKAALEARSRAMVARFPPAGLPEVHLSSEHWFDDVVFERLMSGEGLPYPGGRIAAPRRSSTRRRSRSPLPGAPLRPAARAASCPSSRTPSATSPSWKDTDCLEPLLDAGACLLLDVCALVGKYGATPRRAAEKLLEEDAYEAACTDAHRPEDVDEVRKAIDRLDELVGKDERIRLLDLGPRAILAGTIG